MDKMHKKETPNEVGNIPIPVCMNENPRSLQKIKSKVVTLCTSKKEQVEAHKWKCNEEEKNRIEREREQNRNRSCFEENL